VLWL
jgi:hypothetical protein